MYSLNNLRLEISFKDLDQLEKKIEFCLENKIYRINIPCKGHIKKEFLLETIKFIGSNYRNLDITYHYSFFHEYSKSKSISYLKFLSFLELVKRYNNAKILLVSGSKKRKEFDVLTILGNLKNDLNNDDQFGVVYNPYFPNEIDLENERNRLFNKLNTGLIKSIWFQFGTDYENLIREINYIREIKNNLIYSLDNKIDIYGSLFIPSKQFLSRFKFRPWRNVFLSNEYLNAFF